MVNTFEYSLLPIAKCKLLTETEWQGEGENEKGIVKAIDNEKLKKLINQQSVNQPVNQSRGQQQLGTNSFSQSLDLGSVVIAVNPRYFRPTEVDLLIGNASKAYNELNWKPKVKFDELVKIMAKADLEIVKKL